ncbi:MAG: DUF3455 domain-containing protein [Gammaproteobacteria bacterium]
MKKINKIALVLSFFWLSSFLVLAHAETYDEDRLNKIIEIAKKRAGAQSLSVAKIAFAKGIQSYMLTSTGKKEWVATGPLAALYDAAGGVIGETKIGTHYQHLNKPAWEFSAGRVIVDTATPIPGAGEDDVAWLNVDLVPNDLGYVKVLRIATRAGVAPNNVLSYARGASVGIGYKTFYIFLTN